MRSPRSSKLWWVEREGRNFGYVQWALKVFLFTPRIGVSVKQQFTEEEIYKDRDSQITAIEKTFEDAQKSVMEGGKGVTPEVFILFLTLFFPPPDLPAL